MLYTFLVLLLLGQEKSESNKPEMPPAVKKYFEEADRQRQAAIAHLEQQINRRKAEQKKNRSTGPTSKKNADKIKSLMSKVESLKKNDPAFVPAIYPDKLETGQVGLFIYPPECIDAGNAVIFQVLQVIEPGQMLVTGYGRTIWISDISTRDLTDGKMLELPYIFEVIGTHSYPSVLGANKTVFRVRPVVMEPWLSNAERESAKKK